MPFSHCSVLKHISFCRYLLPVQTAPFLCKNGGNNIRFCSFSLLTIKEKKMSVIVASNDTLQRFL